MLFYDLSARRALPFPAWKRGAEGHLLMPAEGSGPESGSSIEKIARARMPG